MKIALRDGAYDVLKWLALIAIPAAAVLYNVLAGVWGWGHTEDVSVTCNAVCAFIGALIGISTASYDKK